MELGAPLVLLLATVWHGKGSAARGVLQREHLCPAVDALSLFPPLWHQSADLCLSGEKSR